MTFSTTTNPNPKTEKNQTTRTSRTKSTTMPVPAPASALTEAFRQLCMRCAIVNAETSSNPNPAAIKAAATEAGRVATLAAVNMLKFCSPFELSAYIESRATRSAIEDGLRDSGLLLTEQTRASSLLEGVAAGVKEVEKAVGKLPVAVAAASCVGGKKRKRGEGEEEEEEE
ncbi:hypothetical protein V500_04248, partial [Pseudogymnoascus sp. VKM F-4518 (FW-2643)]